MVKDLGLASPLQDTLLQLTGIYNLWFSKTSRKTWSTKVMFAEDFPSYHALSGAPGSALGCKFQPSGSIGREVFKSAHPRGFPRSCLHWPRQEIFLRSSLLGDGPSAIPGTSRQGQALVSHLADEPIITASEKTQQHRPTGTFFCRRGIDTHPAPVSTTTDLSACTPMQKNSTVLCPLNLHTVF